MTPYHRVAELYSTNRMSMAEMFNLAVFLSPSPTQPEPTTKVLTQDEFRDNLVLGIIYHATLRYQPVSYKDIGQMLRYSVRTIASSAKRLQDKQLIWKLETTAIGTSYNVNKPCLPESVLLITKALVDLYFDHELKSAVAAECLKIRLAGERP